MPPPRNRSPWTPRPPSQPFPDQLSKFAPSLGPVALPPTPPNRSPNPSLTPSLESRPLVYPPVHQASSGGYPPPPHRASFKKNIFSSFCALAPPSQPFPDPFSWNQGPWSTPPSTRPDPVGTPPPHPTGHPSKNATRQNYDTLAKFVPSLLRPPPHRASFQKRLFFLFVRVRNNKKTTHVAKFAPSLQPKPLPPPSPCPTAHPSLTPYPGTKALVSTRPALVGTPSPPHRASFKKRHFSSFVHVRNNKNTTHVAKFAPPPQPFPGTEALGLPPHPPGQLRWVPPPRITGHPSKNAILLLFVRVRNNKNTTHVAKFAPCLGPVPLPPTAPEPKPLDAPPTAKPTLP